MSPGRCFFASLLFFTLAISPPTSAGQPDDESALFPETVSTPSRRPQPIDESPSSITVISAEDIRRSGAVTIPEALALLPGVDSLRLSEASVEISIRGFNGYSSDKVLVMLDSRPLFNLANASVDWNLVPVSIKDVDRIELARGPGSALYGENAFFGVINIITKAPDKYELAADAGGGPGPSWRFYSGGGTPNVRVSAECLEHARFSTTDTDLSNTFLEDTGVRPMASRAIVQRAFLRTDLENEGARLVVSGGAARVENDFSVQENVDRSAYASTDLFFTAARVDFISSLRASYQDQEINETEVFPSNPFRDFLRVDYELQGVATPFANDVLVFGGQYSHRAIHDDVYLDEDRGRRRQDVVSAYFENQLALFEKTVYLSAGLRLDSYPEIGQVLSPRAGLILLISKEQALKIYWGQAFRSPTLYDLHGVDDTMNMIVFLGNDGLKPESISSGNVDYTFHAPGRIEFSINLYYHDVEDIIVFKQVSLTPLLRTFRRENEERGVSYGGEVSARVFLGKNLEVWGNYSYDQAVYIQGHDRIDAPFSPRDKAHLGVYLHGKSWDLSVWSSHVGDYIGISLNTPFQDRIDMKGYSFVSARAEVRFTERLGVSVMMNDVLGKGHFETPVFAPVMPYYFVTVSWRDRR